MPFPLIDRITELDPDGGHVRARKALSLAEEYLQDHFPRFPVMPGVLMLEALFQASAYLVLWKDQFARPLVRMAEARNVKYADFVMPGDLLEIESRWMRELDEDRVLLRAEGRVRDEVAVSGRLVVVRTSNAELDRVAAGQEELLRKDLRRRLKLLWRPAHPAATATSVGGASRPVRARQERMIYGAFQRRSVRKCQGDTHRCLGARR